MLNVDNRFWFVATPRTGSRGMTEALKSAASTWIECAGHHPEPEEAKSIAEKTGLPIVTVIREPLSMAVSWWCHAKAPMPFDKFCEEWKNSHMWTSETMYPYRDCYPNILFAYNRNLKPIMELLGYPHTQVPVVGQIKDKADKYKMTGNVMQRGMFALQDRYEEDWQLWYDVERDTIGWTQDDIDVRLSA